MADQNCPLCGEGAQVLDYGRNLTNQLACERCGKYWITEEAEDEVRHPHFEQGKRAMLSGVTREQSEQGNPITVCSSTYVSSPDKIGIGIAEILDRWAPRSARERIDRGLQNLARKSGHLGGFVRLEYDKDWPLLFAENRDALHFTIEHMIQSGLIAEFFPPDQCGGEYALTVKGWDRIEELDSARGESHREVQGKSRYPFAVEGPAGSVTVAQQRQGGEDEYEVALSFAGEDQERVEPVARALTERGVKVFYAPDEKATLWGKDLREYLGQVYQVRSRFVIAFLSEHSAKKPYPKYERGAAGARALKEDREYLLPVRLDDAPVPDILPTTAYLDARTESPEVIARCVLTKLGRQPRRQFHTKLAAAIMAGKVQDLPTVQDMYAVADGVDRDKATHARGLMQALREFRGHVACGNKDALGSAADISDKMMEHFLGTVNDLIGKLDADVPGDAPLGPRTTPAMAHREKLALVRRQVTMRFGEQQERLLREGRETLNAVLADLRRRNIAESSLGAGAACKCISEAIEALAKARVETELEVLREAGMAFDRGRADTLKRGVTKLVEGLTKSGTPFWQHVPTQLRSDDLKRCIGERAQTTEIARHRDIDIALNAELLRSGGCDSGH
jgi:hypothetical protein